MPSDLTTVLGALLADRALRISLRRDPAGLARTLQIGEAELQGIDPDDLERQAEALVAKRLQEIHNLLPFTMNLLNPRGASLFKEYAPGVWPEGHLRHYRD